MSQLPAPKPDPQPTWVGTVATKIVAKPLGWLWRKIKGK